MHEEDPAVRQAPSAMNTAATDTDENATEEAEDADHGSDPRTTVSPLDRHGVTRGDGDAPALAAVDIINYLSQSVEKHVS